MSTFDLKMEELSLLLSIFYLFFIPEWGRNHNKVHFSILCNDQDIKPSSKMESDGFSGLTDKKVEVIEYHELFCFFWHPWSRDSLEGMIYIPQCPIGSCFFTIWPHFWGNSSIEFYLMWYLAKFRNHQNWFC